MEAGEKKVELEYSTSWHLEEHKDVALYFCDLLLT